jgi:hypothetical protein
MIQTPCEIMSATAQRWKPRASCLVLGSLMMQVDCGSSAYVVHRYELPMCPEVAFTFPRSARHGPYRLAVVSNSARCAGFTTYELTHANRGGLLMTPTVRLNRGQRCSLDVVYNDLPEADRAEELARTADTVAGILLKGSNIAPALPAAMTERFQTRGELWCPAPPQTGTLPSEPRNDSLGY